MAFNIPNGWKKLSLSQLGEVVGGGTPSTKKVEYYEGGKVPWLTPKDLSGYTSKYISKGERNITALGLKNSSAKLLPEGTVLFSSRAPIGYVAIALNEISTNQGFKSIIPNKDVITSDFIYYLLIYNTEKIKNISSGSTFKEVSGSVMKNFEVLLPSYKEQIKISKILSSLDDKIETNNKIIANLESQAQAIFKSWFVDFEPFQDGDFIESELGMIPEGWEAIPIKEMSRSVITGKTPSTKNKEYFGNYMPFIKIPDMHNKIYTITTEVYLSEKGVQSQKNKTLPMNSICVSCIATVGLVNLVLEESQTNQQINSIVPDEGISPYYLYFAMKNLYDYLNSIASGSTQKNINKSDFESIKIINPSYEIMNRYHNFSKPLFELIKNFQLQNQNLAQIRETLLPKLMSGQIRLGQDDIEEVEKPL